MIANLLARARDAVEKSFDDDVKLLAGSAFANVTGGDKIAGASQRFRAGLEVLKAVREKQLTDVDAVFGENAG